VQGVVNQGSQIARTSSLYPFLAKKQFQNGAGGRSEFAASSMRGYVRLRAEERGVQLACLIRVVHRQAATTLA
jgi:hypothetical protein